MGKELAIAAKEFGVKKVIGIDNNSEKIKQAQKTIKKNNIQAELICQKYRRIRYFRCFSNFILVYR